ncbi:MAG: hypothetical protein ABWY06_04485 [Pseudomonas sp.]|uniref:hypothetical protein n=1 Tax=Pseudomonas sp. TaxID=306 RepID=UPI003391C999
MSAAVGLLYLLACSVCGIMGRKTTIGFVGHLVLAFFLTPPIDFLVQLACRPSQAVRQQMEEARLRDRR